LTAALPILACDRGGPRIIFQMPLYPMIDDRNERPSSHEVTSGSWTRSDNITAWRYYVGDRDDVPSMRHRRVRSFDRTAAVL
jgi:acetyl esterase/lipase